jgi:hypothetical protein
LTININELIIDKYEEKKGIKISEEDRKKLESKILQLIKQAEKPEEKFTEISSFIEEYAGDMEIEDIFGYLESISNKEQRKEEEQESIEDKQKATELLNGYRNLESSLN